MICFKKKTVKCMLGFWYLPSCFFPLLYESSFLIIQLNDNKYTFMKKTIFLFLLFDSKRGFYTKFLERLKESFQERQSRKTKTAEKQLLDDFPCQKV